jgi:hypothetical protein
VRGDASEGVPFLYKFLVCAIVAARIFALTVPTDMQEPVPAEVAADRAHEACDTFATKVCRVDVDGPGARALVRR